jgi:hypothetical protein
MHPQPPRAAKVEFKFWVKHRHWHEVFGWFEFFREVFCKKVRGEQGDQGDHMQFSMLTNQSVGVVGFPVDVNGNPSNAKLSAQNFASSDPTIFTVTPDPSNPSGAIITGVGAGTATLTETATATEPDGVTTEKIQGVATIVLTVAPPPPPPAAASIAFTFGTPK